MNLKQALVNQLKQIITDGREQWSKRRKSLGIHQGLVVSLSWRRGKMKDKSIGTMFSKPINLTRPEMDESIQQILRVNESKI